MQRVTIILNPAAGRGAGARCRIGLEQALAREPVEWRIVETSGSGTATPLARAAAQDGAAVVVAAGGDGTISEVLNGIIGTDARLGIIPLGTGNDFARCAGLISRNGLDLAIDTILHGEPRRVDAGCVHGRWFLNAAGCGFDALVAARVNRGFHLLRGTSAYLAAVLETLSSFHPALMRITTDGETRELRGMLCAVANAQSYGGGMRIAPDAQFDDGLFDLCIIGDAGRGEFLCTFPRVFQGTHITHPKVTMLRARHVEIESDPPLPVLVDGEILGATPATFTLTPRAIEVLLPQRESHAETQSPRSKEKRRISTE